MKGGISRGAMVKATMKYEGNTYDIIQFGVRLRVIDRMTDRSLDSKGYISLTDIRFAYPGSQITGA